jgi:UDP-N-acetylmuramyl pentapeptide phosphotransferase/UDP-N-acetylglucosamine-1-phosphate transferase
MITILFVPLIIRLSRKLNIVDVPGPRRVHETPIPHIGGIVFVIAFIGIVVPAIFLSNHIGKDFHKSPVQNIAFFVGAMFIFAIGLIDDMRHLRGPIKLACLLLASLMICASGSAIRSISVGQMFVFKMGWAAWPVTCLWIMMITVCFNFIDGLDGLATGIAMIVCSVIAILTFLCHQPLMTFVMLTLLGSLTGFMCFNFHPAKIFMGDCGSMFLGFVIGAGSVVSQTKSCTGVGMALPFLALGVPIFDTVLAILRRRLFERRSVFSPDRNHLHHRLLDSGLCHRSVVFVIHAVTILSVCLGSLMLVNRGMRSICALLAGLFVLCTAFLFLYPRSSRNCLRRLKSNLEIAHNTKLARRIFERTQLEMRDIKTSSAWWEAVCHMCKDMDFHHIELWDLNSGQAKKNRLWNLHNVRSLRYRVAHYNLPLRKWKNNPIQLELKAHIYSEGRLELGGLKSALLARLIDEFPIPHDRELALEGFDRAGQADQPLSVS